MKKYVITGGEGFIGGHIKEKISGTSYDLKSGQDILDSDKLSQATSDAAGIFHCAAKISVPESVAHPEEYYRTNVLGSKEVLKAAQNTNAKIIFCSSAAVYGESNTPVTEISSLSPASPYAENKKEVEELLEHFSVPSIALRYFNVYGPGQSSAYAGVITTFITRALAGEDLIIYGDGSQVRDFIFIDDVVNANISAMEYENTEYDVFNIGSGKEISIKELAEKIISLTNSSSKIIYESPRAGDITYSCANISKAKSTLNWSPQTSLEEGLRKTIEYYRTQQQ